MIKIEKINLGWIKIFISSKNKIKSLNHSWRCLLDFCSEARSDFRFHRRSLFGFVWGFEDFFFGFVRVPFVSPERISHIWLIVMSFTFADRKRAQPQQCQSCNRNKKWQYAYYKLYNHWITQLSCEMIVHGFWKRVSPVVTTKCLFSSSGRSGTHVSSQVTIFWKTMRW